MSGYKIVVEKARGNYSAYAPGVPGCVATGTTRAKARENLLRAIQFHLEGCEKGAAKPPASAWHPNKAAG